MNAYIIAAGVILLVIIIIAVVAIISTASKPVKSVDEPKETNTNPPEVFAVCGVRPKTYLPITSYDKVLAKYPLATEAQMREEEKAGASWCAAGFLKDTPDRKWPSQQTRGGCGAPGVSQWNPPKVDGKDVGCVNVFGVKPSAEEALTKFEGLEIWPWQDVTSDPMRPPSNKWSRHST